jgi:hypothetical protein
MAQPIIKNSVQAVKKYSELSPLKPLGLGGKKRRPTKTEKPSK